MPDSLADTTVLDLQGKAVPLGATFADRPAVLLFLRHFG